MDTRTPDALADPLAAQAKPLAAPDTITVDIAAIPKPPAHLVDELDNQASGPAAPKPEVATLTFVGDRLPFDDVQLTYPFLWEGERVDVIRVRQITTAEMGERLSAIDARGGAYDVYDVYAVMTGLPAAVLRALPAADGDRVTLRCYDFLPPSLIPVNA